MGGSSSKRIFFWQKKKSPAARAWSQLRRALPIKKRRKRRFLDNLKLDNLRREKQSQRRFSLSDKKDPNVKRLSLVNIKKSLAENVSPGREKDGGGLMKKKVPQEPAARKGSTFDKLQLSMGAPLGKIRLKNEAKASLSDPEVHPSTTLKQEPKKAEKPERKKLVLGLKRKDVCKGATPQPER